MSYQYKNKNPLEEKIKYEYSPYLGEAFIDHWTEHRNKIKVNNPFNNCFENSKSKSNFDFSRKELSTREFINFLKIKLNKKKPSQDTLVYINWLIKRFELTKRIYKSYIKTEKGAKSIGDYKDFSLYLDFAEILTKSNEIFNHLPSLNALLKILDIIFCYLDLLNNHEKTLLKNLVNKEKDLVFNLRKSYLKLLDSGKNSVIISKKQDRLISKDLKKVLFIAADTTRSRCYAQNLQKYGFTISNSILITSESNSIKLGKTLKAPPYSNNYISGVFNADLSIPIEKSLKNLSKEIKTISSGTINCKIVEDYIIQQNPNLIIYSGFGGEIVSSQLIKIGVPFLHLHAGFLPTFRGSTTIYYSLLKTAKCGVSAIILSSNIDEGNIIATKYYDPPDCICNLDYEYDSAIRSNLLIEVLNKYYRNNYELSSVSQENDIGETYYVIHPLLKHLTLIPLNIMQ